MSAPWNDDGPVGLVYAYSEWLDARGLVVSDKTGDKRSHAELAEAFMAEREAGK